MSRAPEKGLALLCGLVQCLDPPLGSLIRLGRTQTCSLSLLHTLSAIWFVHICGIWAHSAFGKNLPCSQSRCQDNRWFTRPYVRLSPIARSICNGSDAHPYVTASDCVCVLGTLFMYVFLLFYRGIQHQYSGEATSHHRLGSCGLGLPHRCGRHHHRLQPVSQSSLSLFKQACCEPTHQLHRLVKWNVCSFVVV